MNIFKPVEPLKITHVIFSDKSAVANAFTIGQVEGVQPVETATNDGNKTYRHEYEYCDKDERFYYRGCSVVGPIKI